jgi:hypothetical protein
MIISSSDASRVIQKALNSIADTGGKVFIRRGNYTIKSKISLPNTVAWGEDKMIQLIGDNAVLTGDVNLADNMIELNAVNKVNYSYRISGLHIYPSSKSPNYYGIFINNVLNMYIDHVTLGWEGLKITNSDIIYLSDLYIVDTSNEGIYLDHSGFVKGVNLILDNVGGYGGYAGYNGLHIANSIRVDLSNFWLFGQKGNYGGQEHGLYINGIGQCNFVNFEIDGFKKRALKVVKGSRLTFCNFYIHNMDEIGLELATDVGDIMYVTVSNFVIEPDWGLSNKGVGLWSSNGHSVCEVCFSNGVIRNFADGYGISLGDDGSSGAVCKRINVNNVIFENLNYGIDEAYHSDYNLFTNNQFINVTNPIASVGLRTRIKDNLGYDTENFKAPNLSITIGLNNVYGPARTVRSRSKVITFPRVKITWGGTFGTGETVTVKVEAVYSDETSAYTECPATSTGSFWLTDDNIYPLISDGKDIISLNIYAKTNHSTTNVTVTVDVYGKA